MLFFLLQLSLGFWHHYRYRVQHNRDWKAIVHVWFGRVLMILGVFMTAFSFNGNARIGSGVAAIAVFLFYVGVAIRAHWEDKKRG
jgi:hypothetical protein